MKQRPFATMILSWLLLGCTSYHPYNMTGGYHEAQIGPDMFQVTFRGNGYTHKARAQDMTMLRAADVAASHGHRYFAITTDLSFDTWDISLHHYTGVLVIKGFIKRPLDVPVYEVVPLQQTLKINYGID